MNVLAWHVHGSWMTSFVQGPHRYLVPLVPDRGPDGRGRAGTYPWPESAVEVTPEQLASSDVDVVVLQRPHEEQLAREWLGGRIPGRDVPMVYVEHNAPQGEINAMRHPLADRHDVTIVHVTPTNALFWDTGSTPTVVIEHGVPDPGARYTGELDRGAVVVNEPVRRARVTGTDLLPGFAKASGLDVFGMKVQGLERLGDIEVYDDLPQRRLHAHIARRRFYLHPYRWTSLGLALIEAMLLGMPVVALATLEVPEAVPDDAGAVSNRLEVLHEAMRRFVADPDEARRRGERARAVALERYGIDRFVADWDRLLKERHE